MPNRYVRLTGFDQRLDLTKPDLGVVGGAALLEQLLNDRRLPVPLRGLTCAEVCERRGFVEPMSVYRRLGKVVAAHMRSDAEDRHYAGGESDEHKAYKDRAVRAAEEGGHTAVQERSSKDRAVRSDVLIRGADGVLLGFESQLSPRNPREIQARDVAARRAGVLDAWQTDSQNMARDTTVPWLRTDRVPLELIMKRNSPIPFRGGIRRIELAQVRRAVPGTVPEEADREMRRLASDHATCGTPLRRIHPRYRLRPLRTSDRQGETDGVRVLDPHCRSHCVPRRDIGRTARPIAKATTGPAPHGGRRPHVPRPASGHARPRGHATPLHPRTPFA